MNLRTETTDLLWRRYRRQRTRAHRDALLAHYQHLAYITAARFAARLPPHVEIEDLQSHALLGLLAAVEQFDPTRGVKFETFALHKQRGAILEALRENDWVPRLVRERTRAYHAAVETLQDRLGQAPSDAQLARELGMNETAFRKFRQDMQRAHVFSLDNSLVGGDDCEENALLGRDVLTDPAPSPLDTLLRQEHKHTLQAAVARLPERERDILCQYYYAEQTFKAIGKALGLSESRAYQLHARAVARLRGYLQTEREG